MEAWHIKAGQQKSEACPQREKTPRGASEQSRRVKTRCVFKGLECNCFAGGSMGNPLKISEVKACDDESDLTSRRTPGFKSLALKHCGGSIPYQS